MHFCRLVFILGVSTFFSFTRVSEGHSYSDGVIWGTLKQKEPLDYAVANVFKVILLYAFPCLISADRFAEVYTSKPARQTFLYEDLFQHSGRVQIEGRT